jgi:hypothetical protein
VEPHLEAELGGVPLEGSSHGVAIAELGQVVAFTGEEQGFWRQLDEAKVDVGAIGHASDQALVPVPESAQAGDKSVINGDGAGPALGFGLLDVPLVLDRLLDRALHADQQP